MNPERPSVLVIEDAQSIIDVLHAMLAPYGVEVVLCNNLDDAKRLVTSVCGVICDVHLGAVYRGPVHGIDIAAELRRDGFEGRIVMISGDNRRGTVEGAIRAGASAYLVKPFSQQLLLEKIMPDLGGCGKAPRRFGLAI